jgi:hypothetical protein
VTGRLPSGDEAEFVCKFLCIVATPPPCNETAQPGIGTKDPTKAWRVRPRSPYLTRVHTHGMGRKRLD